MSKKYKLTKEHEAQLPAWRDKFIANTMSTKKMDDEEKEICRKAVKAMYSAADLTPPPDERIVFVSSPFISRFAGGFAAAIWHMRKNKKAEKATNVATWDTTAATEAAVRDATAVATWNATWAAVRDATRAATAATWDATVAVTAATWDATRSATRAATAATEAAVRDATAATRDAKIKKENKNWYNFDVAQMVDLSNKLGLGKFGLECAISANNMYQGGNQWSASDAFITFFRYIAKLDIYYSNYDGWEKLAMHSGPRIIHPEFCIISDRPEVLKVDEHNRPHCENGPFCKWRDGSALFAWHGVRVPEYWIMDRHLLTAKEALQWPNLEERRAACEIIGWAKILKELNSKTIDKDPNPMIGELVEVELPDAGKERFLRVLCGTGREFALCVTNFKYNTARECNAATYGWKKGFPIEQFIPVTRT